MAQSSKGLKKELTLFSIFCIATGGTVSAGFFLLPGQAAEIAGGAFPLAFLFAALLLLPGLLSKTELTTAMPRAGGIYYYLDRSMGPMMGTIGGFGTWFALILKASFALVGAGAYLRLLLPEVDMQLVAIVLAVIFGLINLLGAKVTGSAQIVLLIGLLALLAWFTGVGAVDVTMSNFVQIFDIEAASLFEATGLVIISYMGITKVASVAEEVKDPERTMPRAIFLAFGTSIAVYVICMSIMVGVVGEEALAGDMTPLSSVAEVLFGRWGVILMTVAMVLAFSSVANAGILSASRYPLAMSRDHLLPGVFSKLGERSKTPANAIYLTLAMVIFCIVVLNPLKIAKLGSAFKLIMFALSCLAVIVMRESKIEAYDPSFRAPLYPWLQISGIVLTIVVVVELGWLSSLFALGLMSFGTIWYFYYAQNRVVRDGAIYHMFARLGERRFEGLDRELREILKEKGLRDKDPFDAVIASASVVDLGDGEYTFRDVVVKAAVQLERSFPGEGEKMIERFMQGTQIGATPVAHGAALPHIRMVGIDHPEIVLVRSKRGVFVDLGEDYHDESAPNLVFAFFFLVSPEADPGQHLRILAQIAGHVDDHKFMTQWMDAVNEQEMKEVLLRDDHYVSIVVRRDERSGHMIGNRISELELPPESLIALIHRNGDVIVPMGKTVLEDEDRLTIIGHPHGIRELYDLYVDPPE